MAFRFCDSFDHYTTQAEILAKWTNQFSASISTSLGRRNGGCLVLQGSGLVAVATVSKTFDFQTNWIVGFAMLVVPASSGMFNGGTPYQLLNNGTIIMSLRIESDSSLSLVAANGTVYGNTLSFTPPYTMPLNNYIYVEISNALSNNSGDVEVTTTLKINGTIVLNGLSANTGVAVNTLISGAANANRHAWAGAISSPGVYIDDLYIFDNQGSTNNSFAGDISLGALVPASDLTVGMNIFPTTPTTHYSKLNEIPPDGDTTYVYSNTVGNSDDYDWQQVSSFVGSIPFVQILYYVRKDDEGSRTFQHTIGGNTYSPGTGGVYGTPEFALCDSYLYYPIPLDTNPAVGTNWTLANLNAQDFGEKVSS